MLESTVCHANVIKAITDALRLTWISSRVLIGATGEPETLTEEARNELLMIGIILLHQDLVG